MFLDWFRFEAGQRWEVAEAGSGLWEAGTGTILLCSLRVS